MSSYNISSRYAKALLNSSVESNAFEKVSEDVQLIFDAFKGSRELRSLMHNPIIRDEKKSAILDEVFGSYVSPETMKFLRFVVDKNRGDMLIDIMQRFIDNKNERLGILKVDVVSGSEMNTDQKKQLEAKLEEKTGKKIVSNYIVDEELIGGFKLQLKDTVIDASVKYQLEKLKKSFMDENLISTN